MTTVKGSISFLDRELILFGGKGGVGKTTCSTSTAIYLARSEPDKKILIFSTDPAHSLSDSFDYQIGNQVTLIKGFDNLYALEINIKKIHEEFKIKHGVDIFTLASRIPYVDRKVISDLFDFSMPGMDELMAMLKIIEHIKTHEYDHVIMDTAPTGHTLRLLELPDILHRMLDFTEQTQKMYRFNITRFYQKKYIKDRADRFLDQLRSDVKTLKLILKDNKATEFVPVTIPEAMGIYETCDLINNLNKYRISVKNVIVNGINPPVNCDFCMSRKKEQERYIKEIGQLLSIRNYGLIRSPLYSHEIRGVNDLEEFADNLYRNNYKYDIESSPIFEKSGTTKIKISKLLKNDTKILLFGGKGGVGKTTCAVSTALCIARIYPDKKILIFSTDPAHSLSDSLGFKVGNMVTTVEGFNNLFALEINPAKVYEHFKKPFQEKVHNIIDNWERDGLDLSFERRLVSDFFTLSPPGLDELMAGSKVLDFLAYNEYDLIILDTAPSGHTIRLLTLPEVVINWFTKLIKYLHGFDDQYDIRDSIEELVDLLTETKENVLQTQQIINDAKKTSFVVVTIPEAMSVLETERLLDSLYSLKIPSKHILINKVIPATSCNFCLVKRNEQEKYIKMIRELFSWVDTSIIPLLPHEVRGTDMLKDFADVIYEN